mgnify:CR=1 FL=1
MLRIISLIIAFIAINTHANTVYKCQDGEHIIFSQMPCETDNAENKQLDYSNVQNTISSQSTQPKSSQNNTTPTSYMLSKKKERSLAKIERLKQKYNDNVEEIKANALTAGVNRAGASYLQLLNDQITEVHNKYQKNLKKEQQTLDKIEQEINKLN